jgi:hypothetical protein
VARFMEQGSQVLNTAEEGAITYVMTKNDLVLTSRWRQEHRRYWMP